MSALKFFAGMFAAGALLAAIQEPLPVEGGLITGTPGRGWNVREFRGIPFAAPPVGNLRFKDLPWTDLDRKLAIMLSTYWSNFGKTGDPNGAGLPPWSAYNPNDEQLLNIGDEFRVEGFNRAGVELLAAHEEQGRRAGHGPRWLPAEEESQL
jgi:carboxylesterase type B